MCTDVCINGEYASNQGELRKRLGGDLVYDERDKRDCEPKEWDNYAAKAFSPEVCLCVVDLAKTAEKYGYDLTDKDENGEYDPFNFYFVKRGIE